MKQPMRVFGGWASGTRRKCGLALKPYACAASWCSVQNCLMESRCAIGLNKRSRLTARPLLSRMQCLRNLGRLRDRRAAPNGRSQLGNSQRFRASACFTSLRRGSQASQEDDGRGCILVDCTTEARCRFIVPHFPEAGYATGGSAEVACNARGIRGSRRRDVPIERRGRDAEAVRDLGHADVGIG